MARLTGEFKRACLRTLYRSSQTGSGATTPPSPGSLAVALDAFQDAGFAGIQTGKITTAAASVGRSASFAVPQIWMSLTAETLFELTEELEQVYADNKANLIASGTASPTDEQIFNAMMADDRLATITEVRKDFTTLRWPTGNRF